MNTVSRDGVICNSNSNSKDCICYSNSNSNSNCIKSKNIVHNSSLSSKTSEHKVTIDYCHTNYSLLHFVVVTIQYTLYCK